MAFGFTGQYEWRDEVPVYKAKEIEEDNNVAVADTITETSFIQSEPEIEPDILIEYSPQEESLSNAEGE